MMLLMYVCVVGDEVMVQMLIDVGVNLDIQVLSNFFRYFFIYFDSWYWILLIFVVLYGYIFVVQLLLDVGVYVEGLVVNGGEDSYVEMFLQLVFVVGNYELVSLLLS